MKVKIMRTIMIAMIIIVSVIIYFDNVREKIKSKNINNKLIIKERRCINNNSVIKINEGYLYERDNNHKIISCEE